VCFYSCCSSDDTFPFSEYTPPSCRPQNESFPTTFLPTFNQRFICSLLALNSARELDEFSSWCLNCEFGWLGRFCRRQRGRTLDDRENVGLVDSELLALWLTDIKIVPMCVWRRMSCKKPKRRVIPELGKWYGQSEQVWIVQGRGLAVS
jgi:hypothetical protein